MTSERESITAQLDMLSDQFDEMWASGTRPDIEQFAQRMKTGLRDALYELLIPIDIEYRRQLGHNVLAADYLTFGSRAAGIASRELNESISAGVSPQIQRVRDESPASDLLDGFHDRAREIQGYRLLRRIRHGSLGQSWITESQRGQKPWTIKLLPFENERRDELANLSQLRTTLSNHAAPNVQRIREVGVTRKNHLYVVSGYADGLSIIRYCDRECLNIEERLSLFMALCRIVDRLHQNGLAHGHLNAHTVLIQAIQRKVAIVDWGVATAIDMHNRLDEPAIFGSLRQAHTALEYFAPETLMHKVVDQKSDQFALGILLFKLLTGHSPNHDFVSSAREEDIELAADRLLAGYRSAAPETHLFPHPSRTIEQSADPTIPGLTRKQLARRLRRNLDAIVARSLSLDPAQRYESAGQLADDIENHLNGRTVLAQKKRRTMFVFVRRFFGS